MEIYITGDLHGDLRRFQPEVFYEQEGLTKEDLVLVAGDFGCVWHGDERDDEGLDWLEGRPFTTAFVTGNHENYDALRKYPLAEWLKQQKSEFTEYDDTITRRYVERITVVDAETIRIKFRYTDVEIDRAVRT